MAFGGILGRAVLGDELIGTAANDAFAPGARVDLAVGETVAPGQQRTFSIVLQAPATPGFYATSWRMLAKAKPSSEALSSTKT